MGLKILYVTSYPLEYNTSSNIRNIGLIKGLISNGNVVDTISPYPDDTNLFNGKLLEIPLGNRYWLGQQAQSKMVKRIKFLSKIRGRLFRLHGYLSLYDRRKQFVKFVDSCQIQEYYDIIISSSDPKSSHLIAEKLINNKSTKCDKWIQYWGDPFTNDISTKRIFGGRFVRREERRLLSLATKAVYVSPFTVDDIKKQYPQFASKIEFLPIPYIESNDNEIVDFSNPIVAYFGDYHSSNRNIIPFYKSLKKLNIPSYIVGYSDISLESTANISVLPRMTSDQLQILTKDVNIYVCICNRTGTQIPGKVYHHVNSVKPIIIILDGDKNTIDSMAKYFESYNRFYICNNSVDSITNCIEKVLIDRQKFDTPELLNPQVISKKFIK